MAFVGHFPTATSHRQIELSTRRTGAERFQTLRIPQTLLPTALLGSAIAE
ncbi:hypothetical protein [Leptolyngbya sp. NIES-2104]|nr:hypothetical protein [Leptolyngbya sp. NIES-2104]